MNGNSQRSGKSQRPGNNQRWRSYQPLRENEQYMEANPHSLAKVHNMSFPYFEKPTKIGYFSLNNDREYEANASQLKYLKIPKTFPLDLNVGYENRKQKPEGLANKERLDFILKFISDNFDRFSRFDDNGLVRLDADLVCYRGMLRKIMCCPYEWRNDWEIWLTKYRGTLYMREFESESRAEERRNKTELNRRQEAWGFKFEQYCMASSPLEEPLTDEPVDECEEFNCVFKTNICGIRLIFAAEMDGICADQPVEISPTTDLNQYKFIELKTRLERLNSFQKRTFQRIKTAQWWCQSFLVGIDDIYVGLRDDIGLVHKITQFEVNDLPKEAHNQWRPAVCVNFLQNFFDEIEEIMSNIDCPHTVCQIKFNGRCGTLTYRIHSNKTTFSFLPDWFLHKFEKE